MPVLVKDNFDTLGMASAAGSAAMLDNFAPRDAQQVPSVLSGRPAPFPASSAAVVWLCLVIFL